jgi:hypothetical protein
VALIRTDVSEDRIASIFRMHECDSPTSLCLYKSLQLRSVPCSHSCTLKMEAIRSSETSVLIRATRRHLPEDDNHHSYRRGNLKSYILRLCLRSIFVSQIRFDSYAPNLRHFFPSGFRSCFICLVATLVADALNM